MLEILQHTRIITGAEIAGLHLHGLASLAMKQLQSRPLYMRGSFSERVYSVYMSKKDTSQECETEFVVVAVHLPRVRRADDAPNFSRVILAQAHLITPPFAMGTPQATLCLTSRPSHSG